MKKIIAITLALIMSLSCFSLISFAEGTETTEHLTKVPEGYIGVYTIEDLYCVRNDLTANYILMNNIDLSEATAEGGDWNYGGRGWNPIGSNDVYSNNAFSGVFDGNGYVVKGMNIDIKSSLPSGTTDLHLGLFSNVTGTVKNLTVSGSISSEKSSTSYIGGIAGYCNTGAIFENCTNIVNIYCYSSSPIYAGGIVGFNNGSIYNCRNIGKIEISGQHCSASAGNRVYYGYSFAAGIAGKTNGETSIISQCINAGEIIAVSRGGYETWSTAGTINTHLVYYYHYADVYASGIASGSTGSITNCYNIGNISASLEEGKSYAYTYAAGISYDCPTSYSYNVASSSGYSVGSKSLTKCYCLEDTGKLATGVTVLTAGQMKLKSMYSNWNFDNVWTMDGRTDYPYPELRNTSLFIPEDLNHKHTYTSEVTKEATHLAEGETTYTCTCGDSYTEAIAKLTAHTYEEVVTAPTCTAKGYTTYTCACGDSYVDNYTNELDHEYTSEVTTEPTHLTEGVKTFICKCGDTYTEEIAKLEGHTYTSEVTKEPTHYDEGVKTFTCACGDSYTEVIDKTAEHTYKVITIEPECTEKGYKIYVCNCGDSYTETLPKNGHTKSNWIIDKDSTCSEEGSKHIECTVCEEIIETEAIAKIPHNYTSVVTDATCEKAGYTTYTCDCGREYISDKTPSKGHNYIDGLCKDCGESKVENCSCNCHKGGISGFFFKIINFFQKLFGMNKTCACGASH